MSRDAQKSYGNETGAPAGGGPIGVAVPATSADAAASPIYPPPLPNHFETSETGRATPPLLMISVIVTGLFSATMSLTWSSIVPTEWR